MRGLERYMVASAAVGGIPGISRAARVAFAAPGDSLGVDLSHLWATLGDLLAVLGPSLVLQGLPCC